MALADERGKKEEPSNPINFSFTGGLSGFTKPSNPNPVNNGQLSGGVTNPKKKEEEETFANDSGGRDEGGGGGGSSTPAPTGVVKVNPDAQPGTATATNTGTTYSGGRSVGDGSYEAQQEQAEAQRQAQEAQQAAIRRQQAAAVVPQTAPAPNVNDAVAQADATVSTIQEQLNIARNNNSVEDILRLTEDLLQAQRKRDELDAQARAVAGTGTTTSPLVGTPQVVDNEYAQASTVGASNPLANNFAASLRPNDTRSSAFVKNAGRVVRNEEEDEFWRPGITRDQFLEATSNLLSPIANFGVRPAEGAYEPTSGGKTWDVPETGHTLGAGPAEPGTMNFATHMGPELRRDGTVFGTTPRGTSWQDNLGWGDREPSLTNNDVMAPYAELFGTGGPSVMDNILAGVYNASNSDGWATAKASDAYGQTPRIDPETPGYELLEEQRRDNLLQGMMDIDESLGVEHPELTGEDVMNIRQDVQNNYPSAVTNAFNIAKALANPTQDALKLLGPIALPVLNTLASSYGETVENYNNDLSDIPSKDPYNGAYEGNVSDLVIEDKVGKDNAAYDTTVQTAQEAAVNAGLFPGTTAYDNFVDNYVAENQPAPTNNNPVNNNWTPPSQTDIANYIYNLRSNPFLAEVDRGLGNADFNTRNAVMNYANNEYQNRVAEELQNRMGAGNVYGQLSEMDAPGYNPDGTPNTSLETLMNSVSYYDDNGMSLYRNPDGTFSEAVVDSNGNVSYKPYNGDVHVQNRYSPDDILNLFLNYDYGKPGHEGEYLFRGMDWMDNLSEEERAGINALLNAGIFGGSGIRDVNRNGIYNREISDLTEAEYNKFADMFLNNMPALRDLMEAGLLDRYDKDGNLVLGNTDSISDFFFKAYKGGSGSGNGSGSGSGKGSRSYSRGGYRGGGYSRSGYGSYSGSYGSSNYQPYSYSSQSSTPQYVNQQRAMVTPNTATQRSNRVYNIMKNWSF